MSNTRVVFMFSGQGAQYYQMGRELYRSEPIFKKWMDLLDTVTIEILKCSIVALLYGENGKDKIFDTLRYTHPAIFMFEYSLTMTLIEKGIQPDYLLGVSLGEIVAFTVSSGLDPKNVLRFLIRHAINVEEKCEQGGMLAVIWDYKRFYFEEQVYKNSQLAAVNNDKHFVVSGNKNGLKVVKNFLKQNGISFFELPIHYGYHSSYIEPSKEESFNSIVKDLNISFKYSLVSSVKGGILREFYTDYIWDIVREKINFKQSVRSLEERGSYLYVDLSPSGTLANFLKGNLKRTTESEIITVVSPFYSDYKSIEIIKELKDKNNLERKVKKNMSEGVAFVFPGQGSQYKGMGDGLFEEFHDLTVIADRILGYSIKKICMEDPNGMLGQTQYTQPALFIVNALMYLKKVKESRSKPDFVAGHSLGEYNALFAAGVIDFETGVKLVQKRGELMGRVTGGGMAAVIGLSEEQIEVILKANGLDSIDIANLNSPLQIVVSGKKDDIVKAQPVFEASGAKRYIVLDVSGAFHSRYMHDSAKEFENFLDKFVFSDIQIPVISNVYARPYKQKDIKKVLLEQITSSVRWSETVRYIMGKSINEIQQVGPGNVLTGLVRKIKNEAEPLIVNDGAEFEVFVEEEAHEETELFIAEENRTNIEISVEAEKLIGKEKFIPVESPVNAKNEDQIVHIKDSKREINAASLGNPDFMKDYNLKYAYIAGGMYKGIASKEMVVRMGKAGMLSFFGANGLKLQQVEEAINYVQAELPNGQPYGFNLSYNSTESENEAALVDLYLKYGVKVLEVSEYMSITPALARYRIKGLKKDSEGNINAANKIIAKVSRPEVAEAFLSPITESIVNKLLEEKKITIDEARLSQYIPAAEDLCIESDSGGHTDQGVAYAIMPAMERLCEDMMAKYGYKKRIRLGAAGGIGSPEAVAAAYIMGADFFLTGSINQCTVEAGTSDMVKDMLQGINVQDTDYAPAVDMFELGSKVQVIRKGVFFPARANKLYELYRHYDSIDEIDSKVKQQIEQRYFHRSFSEVYDEVKKFCPKEEIDKAEKNPKHKMALIFKWYLGRSMDLALSGNKEFKVDYQVHCGPSLGTFNQWVKGTVLEDWRNRHADEIGDKIMNGAVRVLNTRFAKLINS